MSALDKITDLMKALEAGGYNAAPSTLTQGAALQVEDLSPVMRNVTFDDSHIKLQKVFKVEPCKSTLAQFDRQLSYGIFGGTATLEGGVGQDENSDFVRVTVAMAFYSHTRRVTLASTMVATVDGKKSEERAAADAAKKLGGDIEFDLFRGKADFSNAGVFDGNPLTQPVLPNMIGLDVQIRQSDGQRNSHDLMFAEYGSDDTVVISAGGTLSQPTIQDAHVRSEMNLGDANDLFIDPIVLANYNKITFDKERIVLAGSAQDATGADLRKQWVANGTVKLESSRFLSGKSKPAPLRSNGPAAVQSAVTSSVTVAGVVTAFKTTDSFAYFVTSGNEIGEGPRVTGLTAGSAATISPTLAGDSIQIVITHPSSGVARYFNMYRSPSGGTAASAKFIGRVAIAQGATTTTFIDLGNKQQGFVTGFLLQTDTAAVKELSPYSRLKLAVSELSMPEAHFRFLTLAVFEPRKNVLIDNLK